MNHRPSTALLLAGLLVFVVGIVFSAVTHGKLLTSRIGDDLRGAMDMSASPETAHLANLQTGGLVTLAVGGTLALAAVVVKVARS